MISLHTNKNSILFKASACFVSFAFLFTSFAPTVTLATAQSHIAPVNFPLPQPGSMLSLSNTFHPAMLTGVKINPRNPLELDFIVDRGENPFNDQARNDEYTKLVKYFLSSLTIPDDHLWVNLSPDEPDRIIEEDFAKTQMGMDLLAQDYILKQLTASLLYPEKEIGEKFWKRVNAQVEDAHLRPVTNDQMSNILSRIWIVPEDAIVYEDAGTAWIVYSHLKVMLEEDYKERETSLVKSETKTKRDTKKNILRQIIIPEIEREVNEGQNFAPLRQIVNSMLLATWYKKRLKQSLLTQVFVDQGKVDGVQSQNKDAVEIIYNQYLEAFKRGVYDYIKEDYDPHTQSIIPHKYFSGGFVHNGDAALLAVKNPLDVPKKIQPKVLRELMEREARGVEIATVRLDGYEDSDPGNSNKRPGNRK